MALAPPSGYAPGGVTYAPPKPKKKPLPPGQARMAVDRFGFPGGTVAAPAPVPGQPVGGFVGPPSITLPGYAPDWGSILSSDPTLISGQGDLSAYDTQLAEARKAAIRQAVIAAGVNPGGAIGDIDQQTIDAALGNKFSTAAQLEQSRSRSDADVEARLAARGILSSGGTVGGKQRVQQGFEGASSQLTQQLLQQLGVYESDFAAKYADIHAQYNALKEAAAYRVSQDPRFQPIGETDAVLDPASGLYMTPDGRWYNATGQKVAAPTAATPAAQASAPPAGTSGGWSGAVDAGGAPLSAGLYGFDANGNWIG
jgi:hypothetical protein